MAVEGMNLTPMGASASSPEEVMRIWSRFVAVALTAIGGTAVFAAAPSSLSDKEMGAYSGGELFLVCKSIQCLERAQLGGAPVCSNTYGSGTPFGPITCPTTTCLASCPVSTWGGYCVFSLVHSCSFTSPPDPVDCDMGTTKTCVYTSYWQYDDPPGAIVAHCDASANNCTGATQGTLDCGMMTYCQ
jgi:hypothetical protein